MQLYLDALGNETWQTRQVAEEVAANRVYDNAWLQRWGGLLLLKMSDARLRFVTAKAVFSHASISFTLSV